MKRHIAFAALLAAALLPAPRLAAQDSVADAEKAQAEERHRNVTSRLEKLEESIAAHQKSVDKLADELRKLKDELDRLKNKNESAATQESFKRLQEAITEVDKKRLKGDEDIAKTLADLRKEILKEPIRPRTDPPPPPNNPTNRNARPPMGGSPPVNDRGYKYAIRANDTLSALVKALRAQGHKVTEKMIQDANPGVNWNRLRIGQEIFIPETR